MLSAISFNMDHSKILSSGNGLNVAAMTIFVCNIVENIVDIGEKCCLEEFFSFSNNVFLSPILRDW